MKDKLKKIYELAKVGLALCKEGKCKDVRMFFKYIMDIYESDNTN